MSDIRDLVRITGDISVIENITASVASNEVITATIFLPSHTGGVPYEGEYEVTPSAHNAIVLETDGKTMTDDVTVFKIPYYETSNLTGKTVYIASEV